MKTIEVKQDENLLTLCNIVELLYFNYKSKVPKNISDKMKDLFDELQDETTKDYIPEVDIEDLELIERITFKCDDVD